MAAERNESKHLHCLYKGKEADCPKECSKCAITFLNNADKALFSKQINDAIKLYKAALFVEPKYAEAWCHLAYAYELVHESNNALSAFNKAIAIDPQYKKALFGKAKSLKKLGNLDEAMSLVNEILELYDDSNVESFKAELKKEGAKDISGVYSLQKAIDIITDKAYKILVKNDLLDKDGQIHAIRAIDCKEAFSSKIFTFCKKRYSSLGNEKLWEESILAAFYGSAYVALKYYQNPSELSNIDPFEYLNNNVDLEELDRNTEKLLGIQGDDNQSEKVRNIIYSFVASSTPILERVEPASDLEAAIRDASESAYVMGMLLAMRHHDQKELKANRSALDKALEKLAESTKDYNYTPPEESAMCYSIRTPNEVPLYFRCDSCGKNTSINVYESRGAENQIIGKYRFIANEFTKLGYPATLNCYCDQCANRYFPSKNRYTINNFVFSVTRPDSNKPINSFPQTHKFNDFEYKIALAFLKGADTLTKLSKATNTQLKAEVYLENIHKVLGNVTPEMGESTK